MFLLFTVLLSQVGFEPLTPISLRIAPISFERIIPTGEGFLLCDPQKGLVHVFNKDGVLRTSLGAEGQGESLRFPAIVGWNETQNHYYVNDTAKGNVSIWDSAGNHLETKKTFFDPFFQLQRMIWVEEGMVASVSLARGRFLLGKFNAELRADKFEYAVLTEELVELPAGTRQPFVAKLVTEERVLILAAQSLSRKVSVYDDELNYLRSYTLNSGGWKPAKLKKALRFLDSEKKIERNRDRFSEVTALEGLKNGIFLVGIRNLKNEKTYSYQCYKGDTGLPVGGVFETTFRLVGSVADRLYFVDPEGSGAVLIPYRID